jgi:parallel beta-helix repeat protein
MKNGFLIHLAAKIRRNTIKWRVASAMLAGTALLFAFQGFSRAENDDEHDATPFTDCTVPISNPGLYFLTMDLKQCVSGISITVSDVKLELRGHTVQGVAGTTGRVISVDGGGTVLSGIEIAGPGTVTGGTTGIDFEDVHGSRVHNLIVSGNLFDGIVVNVSIPTNASPTSTDHASHDNQFIGNVVTGNGNNGITITGGTNDEFLDNVVAGNLAYGISVNNSNANSFLHNNLSGNQADGLFLGFNNSTADSNVVRGNTADSNTANGIHVGPGMLIFGNKIEDNTALGNPLFAQNPGYDLNDESSNCINMYSNNSFNTKAGCVP